jgi:hypothetical protein
MGHTTGEGCYLAESTIATQALIPANLIRESAALARKLAETARLDKEPEEAAHFEQLAAEGEARAARLDKLAEARQQAEAEIEHRLIQEHAMTIRKLEHPWRRARG